MLSGWGEGRDGPQMVQSHDLQCQNSRLSQAPSSRGKMQQSHKDEGQQAQWGEQACSGQHPGQSPVVVCLLVGTTQCWQPREGLQLQCICYSLQ